MHGVTLNFITLNKGSWGFFELLKHSGVYLCGHKIWGVQPQSDFSSSDCFILRISEGWSYKNIQYFIRKKQKIEIKFFLSYPFNDLVRFIFGPLGGFSEDTSKCLCGCLPRRVLWVTIGQRGADVHTSQISSKRRTDLRVKQGHRLNQLLWRQVWSLKKTKPNKKALCSCTYMILAIFGLYPHGWMNLLQT